MFRRALPAVLAITLLAGCVERFNAVELGVPAAMGSPAGEPAQGDSFRVNRTSLHALWGLFTFSHASLEKALAAQLVGGRGVAEVRITVRSRWTDLLITGLTLGLLVPRTVTFEGVVTGGPVIPPPPPSPELR